MSLKNYFFPEVLKKYQSKFNHEIELVRFGGHYRLDMGGLTQSGWIIEQIWGKALKNLLPRDFYPKKVLILGLGAASSAKLIAKKWPSAQITGVEIDPVVIQIGHDYFKTSENKNLKIINADAAKFVSALNLKPYTYDLILVDCYLGDQVPKALTTNLFLKKLTIVSKNVLINRLFWSDYQKKTARWLTQIEKDFQYTTCRTPSNLVIRISPA